MHNIIKDIRFWIIFFFIIRLIGITNPPLEMGHNWRQCLTNMIARNFVDNKPNLFYPKIDLAGEKTGIIGSEFPLFNYLIYLFAKLFGYQHWYGRLINLITTSFGLLYFYKSLKKISAERVAFYATLVLSVSVWFGFGRKIMPDTFSVSIMLIGIYHGYMYINDLKFSSIVYFFFFSTLGMLCKIPSITLFSVFGITLFMPEISRSNSYKLIASGFLGFMITCLWYFYWVPYLVNTYGYQLYFPRTMKDGLREILNLWPELLEKFYFVALSSFTRLASFLIGVYYLIIHRNSLRWHIISMSMVTVIFFLFIIKTGMVFPLHSYYIIPYVPIMAAIVGFGLANIKLNYAIPLICVISIEAIANQHDDMFLKESELNKLSLEPIVDNYIPKNDLIIINGTPSPQNRYFANRKGWTESSEQLSKNGHIDSLCSLGAKYLIWIQDKGQIPAHNGKLIYNDNNYKIFSSR